jgi:hypothetical protein
VNGGYTPRALARRPSRVLRAVTWPRRKFRLWTNACPWCAEPLYRNVLHFGPLSMRSGRVRYCRKYHYFESSCTFGLEGNIVAPGQDWQDTRKVQLLYDDPQGHIPEEAKQVIDALVYALHRVVLHECFDDILVKDLHDQTVDAAIRSCEALMDKLIGGRLT